MKAVAVVTVGVAMAATSFLDVGPGVTLLTVGLTMVLVPIALRAEAVRAEVEQEYQRTLTDAEVKVAAAKLRERGVPAGQAYARARSVRVAEPERAPNRIGPVWPLTDGTRKRKPTLAERIPSQDLRDADAPVRLSGLTDWPDDPDRRRSR